MKVPPPPQRYKAMEFTEIGEKLGGLTADQVFNLAEFGKGILDHAGIMGIISEFTRLAQGVINAGDEVFDNNRVAVEILLHIISSANELNEKCWGERKTPFGLTGVTNDNFYFGLKDTTNIQTL